MSGGFFGTSEIKIMHIYFIFKNFDVCRGRIQRITSLLRGEIRVLEWPCAFGSA